MCARGGVALRRPSHVDHFDRVEARELAVLGEDRGIVTQRGGRVPGVVAGTDASQRGGRGGPRIGVNRRTPSSSSAAVMTGTVISSGSSPSGRSASRAMKTEVSATARLTRRRCDPGARREGPPAGPDRRLPQRRSRANAPGSPGARRVAWGTMSATGRPLTVSETRSPARTVATTSPAWVRRSRTETSRDTPRSVALRATRCYDLLRA